MYLSRCALGLHDIGQRIVRRQIGIGTAGTTAGHCGSNRYARDRGAGIRCDCGIWSTTRKILCIAACWSLISVIVPWVSDHAGGRVRM